MRLVAFIALLVVFSLPSSPRAAPDAELWPLWDAHDPESSDRVDHAVWDRWLQRYVVEGSDGINRIDYGSVTETDRADLNGYIVSLEDVPVSDLGRPEQRAYWINLYNAGTVQVVLDHWPVDSIRDIDISPGFFADGPWGKKLFTVEGEDLSLDDIEHRILRPIWRDPRLHYSVNCASIGCPNLATVAFTAENTERLLNSGARAYVNHDRGAHVTGDGDLIVSSLYEWFKDDFGGDDAGVIAHLKVFANEDLNAALAKISRIDDDEYDWSINATN